MENQENQENNKHAKIEIAVDQEQNKEESSGITKFALGDEYHKFNDDDEVKINY